MKYLIASDLKDAIQLREKHTDFSLLFGASDLTLKIERDEVKGIIDLTHLHELSYVKKKNNVIAIGALSTITDLLQNPDVKEHLPLLAEACREFASHQIRNIASLAGNVANNSPVADLIAPLLVLDAKVILLSSKGNRTFFLNELLIGYKSLALQDEIIKSFEIPIKKCQHYYRKVGARAKLNIAKLSLAIVKEENVFFISGTSLNPYIKRFKNLETVLNDNICDDEAIKVAILQDTSPSGSFRSTKEYRLNVLFNLIKDALKRFES